MSPSITPETNTGRDQDRHLTVASQSTRQLRSHNKRQDESSSRSQKDHQDTSKHLESNRRRGDRYNLRRRSPSPRRKHDRYDSGRQSRDKEDGRSRDSGPNRESRRRKRDEFDDGARRQGDKRRRKDSVERKDRMEAEKEGAGTSESSQVSPGPSKPPHSHKYSLRPFNQDRGSNYHSPRDADWDYDRQGGSKGLLDNDDRLRLHDPDYPGRREPSHNRSPSPGYDFVSAPRTENAGIALDQMDGFGLTSRSLKVDQVLDEKETADEAPERQQAPLGLIATELSGELTRMERHSVGPYTDLFRGLWTDERGQQGQVAIKTVRAFSVNGDNNLSSKRLEHRLLRECSIWKATSHPNILPLLGYRLGEDPCLVMPWCKHGNLNRYLANHQGLTRTDKMALLCQAAMAVQYLHGRTPPIVHGNVCPENILINDDEIAVISDFNLSRSLENPSGFTTTGQRNPANRYLAPETFLKEDAESSTMEADIYAFGGVILTATSGLQPHHRILTVGRLMITVMAGNIPTPNDHPALPKTDPLWKWMRMCWALQPVERPSMAEVANMLASQAIDDAPEDNTSANMPSPQITSPPREDSSQDTILVTEILGDLAQETNPDLAKVFHGLFADVYRGTWSPPGRQPLPVAIKYLRTVGMQSSGTMTEKVVRVNKRVDREVVVWRGLRSPYILELYGFRSGGQPCLVSPWCDNGTISEYIQAHALPDADKLDLLVQAGKGLQYLHEYTPSISHGDIKPSNILIDDDGHARLCDFGLSQFLGEINHELETSFVGQGTKGFQPPELVLDGVQSLASDIYAFGCLILTVMSGVAPFQNIKAGRAILLTTAGSIPQPSAHPGLPETDPLWDTLQKCWGPAAERPNIRELVSLLEVEVTRRRQNMREQSH